MQSSDCADPRIERILATLSAVFPASASPALSEVLAPSTARIAVGAHSIVARWIGRGSVRDVREAIALKPRAQVLVASEMSLAARAEAASAGIGWADESGAAEIAVDEILVSRTGRRPQRPSKPAGWTPVVLSVAEALLCGTEATVSAVTATTGHSMSAVARALAFLAERGLLEASAQRGRLSGRHVVDSGELLHQYASAANALLPANQLRCGMLWSRPLDELEKVGARWEQAGVRWAATGAIAAHLLAPHLAELTSGEIYVDAPTTPALHNAARDGGLAPLEGGRLLLRPFPTAACSRLASVHSGLRIVPWPRAYADLHRVGVRGEEAAVHLLESVNA